MASEAISYGRCLLLLDLLTERLKLVLRHVQQQLASDDPYSQASSPGSDLARFTGDSDTISLLRTTDLLTWTLQDLLNIIQKASPNLEVLYAAHPSFIRLKTMQSASIRCYQAWAKLEQGMTPDNTMEKLQACFEFTAAMCLNAGIHKAQIGFISTIDESKFSPLGSKSLETPLRDWLVTADDLLEQGDLLAIHEYTRIAQHPEATVDALCSAYIGMSVCYRELATRSIITDHEKEYNIHLAQKWAFYALQLFPAYVDANDCVARALDLDPRRKEAAETFQRRTKFLSPMAPPSRFILLHPDLNSKSIQQLQNNRTQFYLDCSKSDYLPTEKRWLLVRPKSRAPIAPEPSSDAHFSLSAAVLQAQSVNNVTTTPCVPPHYFALDPTQALQLVTTWCFFSGVVLSPPQALNVGYPCVRFQVGNIRDLTQTITVEVPCEHARLSFQFLVDRFYPFTAITIANIEQLDHNVFRVLNENASTRNICWACGKNTSKKCSVCKRAFYCSIPCQQMDRSAHKQFCCMVQTQEKETVETPRPIKTHGNASSSASTWTGPLRTHLRVPPISKGSQLEEFLQDHIGMWIACKHWAGWQTDGFVLDLQASPESLLNISIVRSNFLPSFVDAINQHNGLGSDPLLEAKALLQSLASSSHHLVIYNRFGDHSGFTVLNFAALPKSSQAAYEMACKSSGLSIDELIQDFAGFDRALALHKSSIILDWPSVAIDPTAQLLGHLTGRAHSELAVYFNFCPAVWKDKNNKWQVNQDRVRRIINMAEDDDFYAEQIRKKLDCCSQRAPFHSLNTDTWWLVIELGEAEVGFFAFELFNSLPGELNWAKERIGVTDDMPVVHIQYLYLTQDNRRSGISPRILRWIQAMCPPKPVLFLAETSREGPYRNSFEFWEKQGFEHREEDQDEVITFFRIVDCSGYPTREVAGE